MWESMRRRLLKFLPIVVIALMVQLLAPIGACWAASIAASDPLAAASICHDGAVATGQADHATDQTGGSHHAHDCGCCLSCGSHAPALIDPPQAAIATPIRHAMRVFWHPTVELSDRSRSSSHAQARAPPQFS
jgi:hypothetical protein